MPPRNRSEQDRVPGFLDCRCRVPSRAACAVGPPQYSSINPTVTILSGAMTPTLAGCPMRECARSPNLVSMNRGPPIPQVGKWILFEASVLSMG